MNDGSEKDLPLVVDLHQEPTIFVDWIASGGRFEDVINVSLATVNYVAVEDPHSQGEVVVAAKLRMSAPFAHRLGQMLLTLSQDPDGAQETSKESE